MCGVRVRDVVGCTSCGSQGEATLYCVVPESEMLGEESGVW